MELYNYKAKVLYVIDGDTIRLVLDKGHGMMHEVSVRLEGINAPELNSPDVSIRAKAQASKAYLENLVVPNQTVFVRSTKWDKYGGRVDGFVWLSQDSVKTVNSIMLDTGHANYYKGSTFTLGDNL